MFRAVDLVDDMEDRFIDLPEHGGYFPVRRRQPVAPVHEKNYDVRLFHGEGGLFPHLGQDAVGSRRLEAAGVYEDKRSSLPIAVGIIPVPRCPRLVDDDRLAPAGQAVEEGRFAHIGPADDGNYRSHYATAAVRR